MIALSFLKKNKPKLGLDITAEGIYCTLLEKKKNAFQLKQFDFEPFEKDVVLNGKIIDETYVSETIKKLIERISPDTKEVSLAASGSLAFTKTISIPKMPLNEATAIIPQEAEKHLPFPKDDINFAFEIIKKDKKVQSKSEKIEVILAALPKAAAKMHADIIYNSGLTPVSIDLSPFATVRAIANSNILDDSDNLILSVMIGYENTEVTVIDKAMPVFCHNFPVGKKNILDILTASVEKKPAEVKKLLPHIALVVPGMNINLDPQLNKAQASIRTVYGGIFNEVQKTIEFYNSQTDDKKEVTQILLSGPGVCVQNIDKYLENKLKITTNVFNPLSNITNNLQLEENILFPVNLPSYTVSIGLAMKGLES